MKKFLITTVLYGLTTYATIAASDKEYKTLCAAAQSNQSSHDSTLLDKLNKDFAAANELLRIYTNPLYWALDTQNVQHVKTAVETSQMKGIDLNLVFEKITRQDNPQLLEAVLKNQNVRDYWQRADCRLSFLPQTREMHFLEDAITKYKNPNLIQATLKDKNPDFNLAKMLIQSNYIASDPTALTDYLERFSRSLINQTDANGQTLLDLALGIKNRGALILVMQKLVNKGADSTRQDSQGETILNRIVKYNSISVTKYFLENVRAINPAIPGDNRVILTAVENGKESMINLLRESGALTPQATREKSSRNNTLMKLAVVRNDMELAQACVSVRPDLNLPEDSDLFLCAINNKNPQMLDLLQKHKALRRRATFFQDSRDTTLFNVAVETEDIRLLQQLLTLRRVFPFFGPDKRLLYTALCHTATAQTREQKDNSKMIVDLLLSNGASNPESFSYVGTDGTTLLSLAVKQGNIPLVEKIFSTIKPTEQHADLMYLAIQSNNPAMLQTLLEHLRIRALISAQNTNFNNQTPLRFALTTKKPSEDINEWDLSEERNMFLQRLKIVTILVQNGALIEKEKYIGQINAKIESYRSIFAKTNSQHAEEILQILNKLKQIIDGKQEKPSSWFGWF